MLIKNICDYHVGYNHAALEGTHPIEEILIIQVLLNQNQNNNNQGSLFNTLTFSKMYYLVTLLTLNIYFQKRTQHGFNCYVKILLDTFFFY